MSLGLPPFRSALPFRLRCADSAQSGAATPFAPDVTDLAEPRTAPSRFANGAAVVAADPRLGVAVAPSAPRPHSAPFRSPDRHRLLDCPAHNVSRPKPIPARRDAVTRFRARQGGCSPSAADSPGQHAIRPPLAPVALNARRKLALPGLMRRGGFDARREQRGSNNECGSFAKLTHGPTTTRARNAESPPLATGHVARPRRWRSGLAFVTARRWHCDGVPSFTSDVVSRVHRPSLVGQPSSSRATVRRPAFPCAHYLPYAQYALLRSESGTLSGHPPGGIFDIRWSSAARAGGSLRASPVCGARINSTAASPRLNEDSSGASRNE